MSKLTNLARKTAYALLMHERRWDRKWFKFHDISGPHFFIFSEPLAEGRQVSGNQQSLWEALIGVYGSSDIKKEQEFTALKLWTIKRIQRLGTMFECCPKCKGGS